MKPTGIPIALCLFLLLWGVVIPVNAHAYLDPGTGALVLQLLAATVLGGLFFLKTFWHKVKSFLTALFGAKRDATTEDTAGTTDESDAQ